MVLMYHLNRYNWLGHKLLTQQKFESILKLKQCLSNQSGSSMINDGRDIQNEEAFLEKRQVSEHMIYLSSVALIETSTHLDEVIYSIQKLNFENNNQYFLLLCHCLFYLGNHESVVALCEKVLAKELDKRLDGTNYDSGKHELEGSQTERESLSGGERFYGFKQNLVDDISFDDDFRNIFARIDRNNLISEPRLWFILGLCLEYQNKQEAAFLAFKVSSNLAFGFNYAKINANAPIDDDNQIDDDKQTLTLNHYHLNHVKFAELSIKMKANFKLANQVLNRAISVFPQNYTLNPMMALIISSNPNSNNNHFVRALDILNRLENHSVSNWNPSSSYNSLAIRCQQKIQSIMITDGVLCAIDQSDSGDENRFKLDYLLVKGYLVINYIVQDSMNQRALFHQMGNITLESSREKFSDKVHKLIDLMKSSDNSGWKSGSLWNNLGLCFLLKGKFIACLTCLMKAKQLEPLDWRICFNLSIAYLQVGLFTQALSSIIATKYLHHRWTNKSQSNVGNKQNTTINHTITTLMAICFDKLNQFDEARRLHIEATLSLNENISQAHVPILSIINYLVFLHKSPETTDPQTIKLKLHLLDRLEQNWLQRNQHDSQYNLVLFGVASRIGADINDTLVRDGKSTARKTYAWAKVDPSSTII